MKERQEDAKTNESEHHCYVCGTHLHDISRHLSEPLISCDVSFAVKLSQITSQDHPNDRNTDVVCASCWSLVENITKQQNELHTLIGEVNDRLARSFQQGTEANLAECSQEGVPEDDSEVSEPATALDQCPSPADECGTPADMSDEEEDAAEEEEEEDEDDPPAEDGAPEHGTAENTSCSECPGRRFTSAASLRRHRRKKHERHLSCPFCSRPVREAYLEMHILIKHSRTERGYLCTLCDRHYETAKYLKVHLRTVHSSGKQFQCTECGRLLANRGSLHAHMQRHARSLQCTLCDRRFGLRAQLETHRRHHTGERPFLCTDCGQAFVSAERLRRHAESRHADTEPTCDTCGRVFATRASLAAHQRTHSDQRPFSCDTCGKTFKRASHLSDHTTSVHGDQRPFRCGHCGKAFTLEPYLRRHERLHAGERPHRCTVCDKSFAKKYNLQAHMKTHESGAAAAPAVASETPAPAHTLAPLLPPPLPPPPPPPSVQAQPPPQSAQPMVSMAPPQAVFAPPPPPQSLPLPLQAGYVWS